MSYSTIILPIILIICILIAIFFKSHNQFFLKLHKLLCLKINNKCPNCGKEILKNSNFCQYCGCSCKHNYTKSILNFLKKNKKTIIIAISSVIAIAIVIVLLTLPLLSEINLQHNRVAAKKAISVLIQSVQLLIAKEEKITDFSASGLTKYFSNVMSGEVLSDEIKTPDGMEYKFISDGRCTTCNACYILVDLNGKTKGPNAFKTNLNEVSDIIIVPIRKNGKYLEIDVKPVFRLFQQQE